MPLELNNLSNDCLLRCKELISERIKQTNLKVNSVEIIKCVNEEIDINKFDKWLDFNLDNFKSKTNQTTYFQKSFENEYRKGTFKITNVAPNTQVLINAMRDNGIVVSTDDSAYLCVLFDYLINTTKIDVEQCKELNQKVLGYMKQGQSFSDYKKMLKGSKTLKSYNIDWNYIENKTKLFIKCWNESEENL